MPESSEAVITLTGDLHARPAASLAIAAAKFSSSIALLVGEHRADAKSVLSVMGIGATSGQLVDADIEITPLAGPSARARWPW